MNRSLHAFWLAPLALLMLRCDAPAPSAPETGSAVALRVAPLTLPGVTNARYRLEITNALDDVVIARELDAQTYGAPDGSLSYVAPCDADPAANPNTVTLTVLDLYSGATTLDPTSWRNPGALSRDVTCLADADVPVDFNLTLARAAQQGFFDVAITFNDLFCSAKLDCTTALLHDATGARRPTVVVAFACTGGDTADTVLYHAPVVVTCAPASVNASVDAGAGPGNLAYGAGFSGTPGLLLGAAIYRGSEQFSLSKGYWNVALALAGTPASCRLTSTATAADGALAGLATPPDTTYPYVVWDVALTNAAGALVCTEHPLDGASPNDGVETRYTTAGPISFAAAFAVDAGTDLCPEDPAKLAPGVCGCSIADTDADGDSTPDCVDGCVNDVGKIAPGVCGCSIPDTDGDGDGTLDCLDGCPSDPAKLAPGLCGCGFTETDCLPTAELVTVANVSSAAWLPVTFTKAFSAPVVVCTPQYTAATAPAPVRVRNVTGGGFDVQLAEAGGGPASGVTVRCLAVEAGVYTEAVNGVKLEAYTFTGTWTGWGTATTSPFLSRDGEVQTLAQSYAHPVVLGQVMSANDPRFSVFFARGAATSEAPTATAFRAGKHVSRDTVHARADEVIGVIVLDAGVGSLAGHSYVAGLGTPTVNGIVSGAGFTTYPLSGLASVVSAVASYASSYGSDGYWPVFSSANPVRATGLDLATDEHLDGLRIHNPERVAYLVFGDCGAADSDGDGTADCADDCPADPAKSTLGLCGCGVVDSAVDSDSDGTLDCLDGCPSDGGKSDPGDCGCGAADTDTDGDGVADCGDACPSDGTKIAVGVCGCGVADSDGDADGTADCVDGCPADPVKTAPGLCGCGFTEASCLPVAEAVNVTGVTANVWQTVTLTKTYTDPVVVCTPGYSAGAQPGVARVRSAGPTSFEVTVATANGTTVGLTNLTVRCLVVNAGVYTVAANGMKLEAVKFTSTVTDCSPANWVGQARSYQNSYTSPVVLGQVMTANDAKYSVFWARGATVGVAPSASALYVGKHSSKDTTARANETIGYLVFEAGTGTLGGKTYRANVGAASVAGFGTTSPTPPPYSYALTGFTAVSGATLSSAGMAGGDGGWPIFYGATPVTTSALAMAVDEDIASTDGRNHITESLAYVVLGTP